MVSTIWPLQFVIPSRADGEGTPQMQRASFLANGGLWNRRWRGPSPRYAGSGMTRAGTRYLVNELP